MNIRLARLDELATYTSFALSAQKWLQSKGLGQYVPAAHEINAPAICARVMSGKFYAVVDESATVAFFCLDSDHSQWWPVDGVPAMYLSGMVVDQREQGRGVGTFIIRWCTTQAVNRGCQFIRLDCHADNAWLCKYYEENGFVLVGRVEQYPGYYGCLYQLAIASGETASAEELAGRL
jgi:GNAT superfamily N-acetyltransferase